MTIRAVIFDLGHTVWDIGPDRGALQRAYDRTRVLLSERLGRDDLPDATRMREAVRDVLRAASESYFMDAGRLDQPPSHSWVDQGFRALGLALDDALVREITPALFATEIESLVCAEGTLDALRALQDAGYALGCVTNTLADGAAIRSMLRRDGIEGLMRTIVVSADEGWRKPHPSLFEKALRELGIAASDAIFVGDSPLHDIGGAQGVGMRAVLTRQYVRRKNEGLPAADATIDHLRELPAVIAKLDAGVP